MTEIAGRAPATPPPPDQWHLLGRVDATDVWWERHIGAWLDRMRRAYPDRYAAAEAAAAREEADDARPPAA